ncbi:hypothetical protein Tco_0086938 [Tanacetum coccineum]
MYCEDVIHSCLRLGFCLGGMKIGIRAHGYRELGELVLESLLGGAIDGSEAMDLFASSSWRKQTKEDTRSRRSTKEDELRLCDIFVVLQGATPICEGSCRLTSLERQEVWNDCRSCKVRVGSNGNLLWEASVLLGRKKAKTVFRMRNGHVEVYGYAFWVNQCTSGFHGVNEPGGVRVAREDDRGVTEGREDVREVFQQRGSGAKRKLSRCGRNQMGNEPILALLEGADDFVMLYRGVERRSEAKNEFEIDVRTSIWRDVRTLAIEEAYTTKYSIHPGVDTMLCGFRLTNRWLSMKKDIAVAVLMPRVVKSRDEIFSRWGYCDNRGLSRLHNQSIERDHLIGIGFVLDFVEFISFTFGDKEMILVIEAELFLGEDATRAIPNMGFNLVDVEGFLYLEIEVVYVKLGCHFEVELECEITLSSLDVLQGISFFLQMGFTLILDTLDGLDVGLLGDVIGEDDCDDDG